LTLTDARKDSKPRCRILPSPRTKIHQINYVTGPDDDSKDFLVVSTEDGRLLFHSTDILAPVEDDEDAIPTCQVTSQLGGASAGVTGRIKDFEILRTGQSSEPDFVVVTAGSDGKVSLWQLSRNDFLGEKNATIGTGTTSNGKGEKDKPEEGNSDASNQAATQVGLLLGTHETGNRITCLKAFFLLKAEPSTNGHTTPAPAEDDEEEFGGFE
jgi:protein MAK11